MTQGRETKTSSEHWNGNAVSRAPRAPVGQHAKASFQPSHPAIFDVMTKIRVSIAALQIFS